jgi:hypothetical protein
VCVVRLNNFRLRHDKMCLRYLGLCAPARLLRYWAGVVACAETVSGRTGSGSIGVLANARPHATPLIPSAPAVYIVVLDCS